MSTPHQTPPPPDPIALVRQLDQLNPDTIRERLDEMERERAALLVLLRAAERSRRATRRKVVPT